jgi:hypothetical protein
MVADGRITDRDEKWPQKEDTTAAERQKKYRASRARPGTREESR